MNVIWDRYLPDSLKATTRQRRGAGIRQRMRHDGNGPFLRNWNSYLQTASNKVELFHNLPVDIAHTVFCEGNAVILHAVKAVSHSYKRILIIANDTDLIVLRISFFSYIGDDKLYVSFGIGNKLRNISIHDICSTMSYGKATKRASRYSRNRRALSSIFRRRKQSWKSTLKERHTKRDMYGANPSSPSKCCLARASGVGSNLKPAVYHSGLPPPLEPPKPRMC